MKNDIHQLTGTLSSLAVFSLVTLGVAGIGYQVFSPNGQLQHWVKEIWESNPLLLLALGGALLLLKRWIENINPADRLADAMVYGAIMSGLFVVFKVFAGG